MTCRKRQGRAGRNAHARRRQAERGASGRARPCSGLRTNIYFYTFEIYKDRLKNRILPNLAETVDGSQAETRDRVFRSVAQYASRTCADTGRHERRRVAVRDRDYLPLLRPAGLSSRR